MGNAPVKYMQPATNAGSGTLWWATFTNLTDVFLSGFSIQAYPINDSQHPLPFFVVEIFIKKKPACTKEPECPTEPAARSDLVIRFYDKSPEPYPLNGDVTVQIEWPAA